MELSLLFGNADEQGECQKKSKMPCILYLIPQPGVGETITCYFIIPEVSTREEAISLMKENFEELGMGNFIYY